MTTPIVDLITYSFAYLFIGAVIGVLILTFEEKSLPSNRDKALFMLASSVAWLPTIIGSLFQVIRKLK